MGGSVVKVLVPLVAAALTAGQPAQAESSVPPGWPELLHRLADQSSEAIAAGGMSVVARGPQTNWRGAVDYTTGYTRRGHSMFGWSGNGYHRLDRRDRPALTVLRRRDASWVTADETPTQTFPQTQVLGEALMTGDTAVESVARTSADGCLRYHVALVGDDPLDVSVCAGRTTLVRDGQTTEWTVGPVGVSPPPASSVVADVDLQDADTAAEMRQSAHRLIRQARRRAPSAADPVAMIHLLGDRVSWLRVRDVRHGVVLIANNRYIHQTWTVTYRKRLTVDTVDHHRPGWSPPRTAITVAPAQHSTQVGAQAVSRGLHAVAWAQGQPGERILMDGDQGSIDNVSGVVAALGADGRPTVLRGLGGMECEPLKRTVIVRRALRRAGKPGARYVCENGGDIDLAWLRMVAPAGWMLSPMPMLHGESTSMDASSITAPGWVRLEFAGEALVRIEPLWSDEFGAVSYAYGPQNLRMPPSDQRIRKTRLDAQVKALRAD